MRAGCTLARHAFRLCTKSLPEISDIAAPMRKYPPDHPVRALQDAPGQQLPQPPALGKPVPPTLEQKLQAPALCPGGKVL